MISVFIGLIFIGFVGSKKAYADVDYDRAVNAAYASENKTITLTLPWDDDYFDAQYVKFTPAADGYYELFLYNPYGIPNVDDVWYDIYPSVDDAYLQQNDEEWINNTYLIDQTAKWKLVSLKKGRTYYVRVGCCSSNSSYNTYRFMYKRHSHSWTRTDYEKGSFEYSGSADWECESCNQRKMEFYPMMNKVVLSRTSAVYTGSVIRPLITVKDVDGKNVNASNYTVSYSNNRNVGRAKVTVSGIGNYTGRKTVTFKIYPKATTVTKVTRAKKAFTVKWKKQAAQTDGYQIQYSKNKNFRSGTKTVMVKNNKTVSRKITKLKAKKKYYVRVRTYKKAGKAKYYSSWSRAKSVTTK